jgi:hypothetical protein
VNPEREQQYFNDRIAQIAEKYTPEALFPSSTEHVRTVLPP